MCASAALIGTHTGEGGPVPPTGKTTNSDYVYVMEFKGDKISHKTKIWLSGWAVNSVGSEPVVDGIVVWRQAWQGWIDVSGRQREEKMAWSISGKSTELCSCKMMCSCWFGPEGEPDQEWCSGAFGFEIEKGQSDGVDLSGTRVALAADWPGNFFYGNGTGRLYLDARATQQQQAELEAIFSGKKGGVFQAVFGGVISSWRPAQVTNVDIKWGDTSSLTVGAVANATLKALQDGAGKPTRVSGAVAHAALQLDGMQVASAKGSRWADPDMRTWEGDSGTLHSFNWSG